MSECVDGALLWSVRSSGQRRNSLISEENRNMYMKQLNTYSIFLLTFYQWNNSAVLNSRHTETQM